MTTKKTILVSALTSLAVNLIISNLFFSFLVFWIGCFWLCHIITDTTFRNTCEEGLFTFVISFIIAPALIFVLIFDRETDGPNNFWNYFFDRDFPSFKFRSPIEIDKEGEEE